MLVGPDRQRDVVGQCAEAAVRRDGDLSGVGPQGRDLGRQLLGGIDDGVDLVVGIAERDVVDRHPCPAVGDSVQLRQAGGHRAGGHDGPVELGHLPAIAGIFVRAGGSDGRGGDAMGLDVVGVAVAAFGVIGDDHVGTQLPDDGDEFADGLAHIGVDKPLPVSRAGAVHP